MTYHLAQLNIAQMKEPLLSETMKGFVAQLGPINSLADTAPGFVWRLQSEAGDATVLRPFSDDMLIVNFSVWKDMEALYNYTYYSDHAKVFREHKTWFESMQEHHFVMWWIPVGHTPSLQEAKERLEMLRRDGPNVNAFTFKQQFEIPV
jgi:Domain of unknown function (DUF3291)